MEQVLNGGGSSKGVSGRKKNTKKIRKVGQADAAVRQILEKKPNVSVEEVARRLKMSTAYASKIMRRLREPLVIGPKSALARLISPRAKEISSALSIDERRFVGLISLIGVLRAEVLVKTEHERFKALMESIS